MKNKTTSRLLRGVLLCALVGMPLAGCEPPPDNSPAISIISPVMGQKVPVGKAVPVLFTVAGTDSKNGMMVPFKLLAGEVMQVGRGRVRAYFDSNNFHAQTISLPDQDNPFLVPDEMYAKASDLVTKGSKRIRLLLFYNDGTLVDPQRSGEVVINVE